MESSRRSGESQSGYNPVLDCSSDGAASEWSTSIETSDASPDRTEATACSDLKAYDLQVIPPNPLPLAIITSTITEGGTGMISGW